MTKMMIQQTKKARNDAWEPLQVRLFDVVDYLDSSYVWC